MRKFHLSLFLFLTFLPGMNGVLAGLIHIGSNKQLFVDDYLIESLTHTKQVMNPAEKVEPNPIIRSDRPWEGKHIWGSYATFDEKDQIFKMWYTTSTFKPGQEEPAGICLATSKDGIHWEKPVLGMVQFQGSTQNNLIPKQNFMPYFFQDLHEQDPSKRYKGLIRTGDVNTPGMKFDLYLSPDGFHWTPFEKNPVINNAARIGRWGPTSFMGWDPIRQSYAVHMENCLHPGCPLGKRVIGRAESPDMIQWSQPETVIVPDDRDFPDTEFYQMTTFAYEGLYVGVLWNFRTSNMTILPQVVFSRDGIRYQRDHRQPFIQPGSKGDFDSAVIYVESVIVHGNRVYLYYNGSNWRADETLAALGDNARVEIGLAIVPLDGFISLDGARTKFSEMVTRSFTFSGTRLLVNAQSALQGGGAGSCDVRVEIADPGHFPLPGFRFEDADPITTTAEAHVVSWKGKSDLTPLAGKPIKLRFYFKNAKLYSFQFK